MAECFKIDGIAIAAPSGYKPVFSTTSTEDSDRDQELTMHNTPMGTIAGYDLTWDDLTWDEIAVILNSMLNKSKFSVHHKDPTVPHKWIDADFYASNYNMAAQTLEEDEEIWTDLSINIRRVMKI
jgi:hypothetical protein|nr:MAG TPA: hypothetical protein [Caudoviricetes sp.]